MLGAQSPIFHCHHYESNTLTRVQSIAYLSDKCLPKFNFYNELNAITIFYGSKFPASYNLQFDPPTLHTNRESPFRSLRAKFVSERDLHGIRVYKYVSAADNFAAPDEVKENICRCKKVEGNNTPVCLKKGAIDASRCQGMESD